VSSTFDCLRVSWSFQEGEVTHEQYMKQLDGFTAARYDPAAWAELFARVGARYAVPTTRHHDGLALWDTRAGLRAGLRVARRLSVVRDTSSGRDPVAGFTDAVRARGLKAAATPAAWTLLLAYARRAIDGADGATRAPQRARLIDLVFNDLDSPGRW
jgi:hypothetical protein